MKIGGPGQFTPPALYTRFSTLHQGSAERTVEVRIQNTPRMISLKLIQQENRVFWSISQERDQLTRIYSRASRTTPTLAAAYHHAGQAHINTIISGDGLRLGLTALARRCAPRKAPRHHMRPSPTHGRRSRRRWLHDILIPSPPSHAHGRRESNGTLYVAATRTLLAHLRVRYLAYHHRARSLSVSFTYYAFPRYTDITKHVTRQTSIQC